MQFINSHSLLKDWYVVNWGQAVNSSSGAIEGIRHNNAMLSGGDIVPRQWFERVPAGSLHMIINDMDAFDEYEPDALEYELLYTVYPGVLPHGVPLESGHSFTRTKWYRVTGYVPLGIASLRDIEAVCKVGDIATTGQIIPDAWLSALTVEAIKRLTYTGIRSLKWSQYSITYEQQQILAQRETRPLLIEVNPSALELKALYEEYPGVNPDTKKKVSPTRKVKRKPKTKNSEV